MGSCISYINNKNCFKQTEDSKEIDISHVSPDFLSILQTATLSNTVEPTYNFTFAKVLSVYDGDTFKIAAMYNHQLTSFNVRLYGIDTPEMNSSDPAELAKAIAAAEFTRKLILNTVVRIEVLTNKRVYDKSKRGRVIRGKYGRLLANVFINDKNLAIELINLGYGKPYFGGHK